MVYKKKKVKAVEDDEDDEYAVEEVLDTYLKIPLYDQSFTHIISRLRYKGFLETTAQLNGGVLPFTTRDIVEKAWTDMVHEKYTDWKTVHSETMKRIALDQGLSQIESTNYATYCTPRVNPVSSKLESLTSIFEPIRNKYQEVYRPVEHPKDKIRYIAPPKNRLMVEKHQKPTQKRRRSNVHDDGFDGDDDGDFAVRPDWRHLRDPNKPKRAYKKRVKVETANTEEQLQDELYGDE